MHTPPARRVHAAHGIRVPRLDLQLQPPAVGQIEPLRGEVIEDFAGGGIVWSLCRGGGCGFLSGTLFLGVSDEDTILMIVLLEIALPGQMTK